MFPDAIMATDVNNLLELGFAALRKGDGPQALTLSEQILAAEPLNPHGHHLAGLAEHQLGDAVAAAQHLEQALRGDRDHPDFHLNYGVVLEHLSQLDEAAIQYRATMLLAPENPKAAANLGFVLRRKGDYKGAMEAFALALELDAGHIGAQLRPSPSTWRSAHRKRQS